MKQWWQALQLRERRLLIGAGIVLAAFVYWLAVWRPLVAAATGMEDRLARSQADVLWMENAAAEVQRLKVVQPTARPGAANASLLALAEQTARTQGLGESFRRGEPDGNKRVRIWMENVMFDRMVVWLEQLDRSYAVRVEAADVDRVGAPGLVNARLTLVES